MNLLNIKNKVEELRYPGGIKGLAEDVGMTEQNLHRCVRENKIQAQDLEKIAIALKVSLLVFFDHKTECETKRLSIEEKTKNLNKKIQKSRVINGSNNQLNESGSHDNVYGGADALLKEKIKYLEEKVREKEERIREKDERIAELKERIEELKAKL